MIYCNISSSVVIYMTYINQFCIQFTSRSLYLAKLIHWIRYLPSLLWLLYVSLAVYMLCKKLIKGPITNRSQPSTPTWREKGKEKNNNKKQKQQKQQKNNNKKKKKKKFLRKTNKCTRSTKTKYKEHEKTLKHLAPRGINHKATQN